MWENCDDGSQTLSTSDLLEGSHVRHVDEGGDVALSRSGDMHSAAAATKASAANGNGMMTSSSTGHPRVREIVVTGGDFERLRGVLDDTTLRHLLMRCQVFARMSPSLKQALVEDLQGLQYTVGMCGDGANDCGALRAADVGVSLSAAEASVAAPFSSRMEHIGSVIYVIREGRSALTTSLACFKYMALYAMIQTITVTLLYSIDSNLSDAQFLIIDLIVILPLAVFMALTKSAKTIAPKSPTSKLISKNVLLSILGHILSQAIFQIAIFQSLYSLDWYAPMEETNGGCCADTKNARSLSIKI